MLARYRYRVCPSPGQVMMLARTFGCARTVFNDALRTREEAHAAGEKVSDTEVQRRVITLAKGTPEREWLGEVASVPLVQACQDARRERRLARAQRELSRKQKGSANRAKARMKVAVQHRKVRAARADHLHKTALRLIRDNQAVYVEDLCVSGMTRRPAPKPAPDRPGAYLPNGARAKAGLNRSASDAGWATLVRLLEEKAERHGRTVVKVGRWFPSSQICSACGVKDGPKPLNVRQWTCAACGVRHDRDVNAARNIRLEGRKVAAGQAETINGCGGTVRPGLALAGPGETATHRSAA